MASKKKVVKKVVKVGLSPKKKASLALRYAKGLSKMQQRQTQKVTQLATRQSQQLEKFSKRFAARGLEV